MTFSLSRALRRALHPFANQSNQDRPSRARRRGYHRALAYESLETRELLAVVSLANMSVSENTGEKPQSKLWEHAGQWWSVMPDDDGTWVWRLDGTSWARTLMLTTDNNFHADVKAHGNLAHVLLLDDDATQLASIEYVGGATGYQLWSTRPNLVNIPLASSTETATIDIDSLGTMWLASDVSSTIVVRYSQGDYSTWSDPITVASGISSDDISVITALPNGSMGVLWSNQSADRFGFRVHQDGAPADVWSANEVPASQSAINAGGGMADDHLNVKVASNGTLYAAVKTSYDSSGRPKIALLVRRPNGVWDNLYSVDTRGTRPIVMLNEAAGRLIVAYTTSDSGGNIVFKESSMHTISFGPRQTLLSGSLNNVTSTKQNFTTTVAALAAGGSSARGALFSFDTVAVNQPPVVDAGPNRTVTLGTAALLDGTVGDDGQPTPASLSTTWSIVGSGSVSIGNASAVDTTAMFNAAGTYTLRLTARDGQLESFDQMTVTVNPSDPGPDPDPDPGPGPGSGPTEIAFQDGLFPSVTYAGTRDTYIAAGSAGTNFGAATTLLIDGSPDMAALLKWDVSFIPSGSAVSSAAIELNITNKTSGNYEVYALQRAWDELSATWQQFAAGQNWSTAGARNSADRAAAVLGTVAPRSTGTYRIALNSAGVAAVQAWVNNASVNYGLIVQDYGVSDGADFLSSETNAVAQRPKLIVNYTPPAAAAAFAAFGSFAGANLPPSVNAGSNLTARLGTPLALHGTVNDDGLSSLTLVWSKTSGPGSVSFADASQLDTVAQFGTTGSYVLRLTAFDGEFSEWDELTVTVLPPL
jgi:hypothetical protein